jgi:hypothetical protein
MVEAVGFGPGCLDGKGGEAHALHEETEDPMLHLEELPRAVGSLAEGHDARITDHLPEWLQIVQAR